MFDELVSIVMSTYNESFEELKKSVESILNQTYKNIEVIIINDNPENEQLNTNLQKIVSIDSRIKLYKNEKNLGLVESLNRALSYANGDYIARMDADDISISTRIENQINYLCRKELDLIGGNILLIDENDICFGMLKFPELEKKIKFFMRWGSCLPHPTWFGKREIFERLQGYRTVLYCEDYDFLLRAIDLGFKLGNCPEECLKYRVRKNSISQSNNVMQYILRNYLFSNRRTICDLDNIILSDYLQSAEFQNECRQYSNFCAMKMIVKKNKFNIAYVFKFIINKYFWKYVEEKVALKLRGMT